MTCPCVLHVHQSNVIYLLMMAPLIQLMTTYIIYLGIYNKVYMMSLDGVVEIGWHWIRRKQNACWWRRDKNTRKKQLPLNLKFETTPIEQVSKHRLLGVTVDEQLKWQTHINICRTVSRNIFLLLKLSQIVSQKLAFFFAHIMSHMNYVSSAWDRCAGVHIKQLYSLHKRAVKFLMPIPNIDYKQVLCSQTTTFRETTIA